MAKRRIITLELDEAKLDTWGADWLRQEDIDFTGWLLNEAKLPFDKLAVCGVRVTQDEYRRIHTVRDWGSLDVEESMVFADADDMPPSDFRNRQKCASAAANMASKRHAPKKFISRTQDGQVFIERVA
jgi:hypothetical protein